LVLVAGLLCYSAIILVQCGQRVAKTDFETLAEHLLGPWGFYLATGNMAMFAYGGMTAYMVILGDTLPPIIAQVSGNGEAYSRVWVVSVVAVLVILPVCLMKSMADLAWASALSVAADAVLIVIVILSGPAEASDQGVDSNAGHVSVVELGVFAGIG
jgi:sodium-coupled neutral amino acid transporter 11